MAFVAWHRDLDARPSRWARLCAAPTRDACWDELLRRRPRCRRAEMCVLEEGRSPEQDRPRRRAR